MFSYKKLFKIKLMTTNELKHRLEYEIDKNQLIIDKYEKYIFDLTNELKNKDILISELYNKIDKLESINICLKNMLKNDNNVKKDNKKSLHKRKNASYGNIKFSEY